MDLKAKLRRCFTHKKVAPIYGLHRVVLIMILNAILGYLNFNASRNDAVGLVAMEEFAVPE